MDPLLDSLQMRIDTFNVYFPLNAFDVGDRLGISLQTRPYMQELTDDIRSFYGVKTSNPYDKIKAVSRMTADFKFNYFMERTIAALLSNKTTVFSWRYENMFFFHFLSIMKCDSECSLSFSFVSTLDEDELMRTNLTKWIEVIPFHGDDECYYLRLVQDFYANEQMHFVIFIN